MNQVYNNPLIIRNVEFKEYLTEEEAFKKINEFRLSEAGEALPDIKKNSLGRKDNAKSNESNVVTAKKIPKDQSSIINNVHDGSNEVVVLPLKKKKKRKLIKQESNTTEIGFDLDQVINADRINMVPLKQSG